MELYTRVSLSIRTPDAHQSRRCVSACATTTASGTRSMSTEDSSIWLRPSRSFLHEYTKTCLRSTADQLDGKKYQLSKARNTRHIPKGSYMYGRAKSSRSVSILRVSRMNDPPPGIVVVVSSGLAPEFETFPVSVAHGMTTSHTHTRALGKSRRRRNRGAASTTGVGASGTKVSVCIKPQG